MKKKVMIIIVAALCLVFLWIIASGLTIGQLYGAEIKENLEL